MKVESTDFEATNSSQPNLETTFAVHKERGKHLKQFYGSRKHKSILTSPPSI